MPTQQPRLTANATNFHCLSLQQAQLISFHRSYQFHPNLLLPETTPTTAPSHALVESRTLAHIYIWSYSGWDLIISLLRIVAQLMILTSQHLLIFASTRIRALQSHLHDYHYYHILFTLHEPCTFCEASSNLLW